MWSAGQPHTSDARRAGLGFVLQAVGTLGGSEQRGGGFDILEGYSGDSEENTLQGEAGGKEVSKGAAVAVQTLADAEGGGRMGRKGEVDAGKRRC